MTIIACNLITRNMITTESLRLTLMRVVATSEQSLIVIDLEDVEENWKHSET